MSVALSTLPVGAKVKDLTSLYPDGSPIIWTVIDHNHSGYPANSTTLFANKYNGFKKSESTKSVTNYNFTISDVYAYMVDEILENYISSSMKKKILKTPVNLLNWYGTGTYDKNVLTVNLDIFLLSYGEMSSSGNLNSGDSRFSYFNDRSKRKGNDVGYGTSGYWTKDVQNSNNLKVLNFYRAASSSSDTIAYSFYSDEQHAIRPVINVKNDIEVQGSPDVDGAYVMSLVESKYLLNDGAEIMKYSSHDSSSVPEMEGYNTPEGLVSSSKELAAGYEAWRAFNSSSGFWHSGTAGAQWISYRFSEEKRITKYSWKTYTATGAPKDWKFEGWDGQKWVVLDIRIGEVGWSNQQEKTYEFSNSNSYIEYRFNLTANNGNGNYDPVYIKLFESPSWEVIGNSIASKELFDLHGMTDLSLITDEAIQQLQSDQVELLCWTDEVDESIERNVLVEGIPNGQLIGSVEDIKSDELESILLTASKSEGANDMKVVVSSDDGGSWMGRKGFSRDVSDVSHSFGTAYDETGISSYEGFSERAFDNDSSTVFVNRFYDRTKDVIVGQKFDEAIKIKRIKILPRIGYSNLMFDSFEVQGSNDTDDGITSGQWDRLRVVQSGEVIRDAWNIFDFENDKKYSSYRLIGKPSPSSSAQMNVDGVSKTVYYLQIAEIEMMSEQIQHVDINDLASVKENGFTPDELNALTKEELASLFPEGKARFAFYLEQENVSDVVEIQSLSVGEKVYTVSPTIEDISVIYDMMEGEKPKLYASRDDGVTWSEVSEDMVKSLTDQPEGNKIRVKIVLKDGQEAQAVAYSWA